MAAPENQPRLDNALFHAPLALGLDPKSPPVRLAFHLWLWRPYQTDCAICPPIQPMAPKPQSPTNHQLSTSKKHLAQVLLSPSVGNRKRRQFFSSCESNAPDTFAHKPLCLGGRKHRHALAIGR